MCDNSVLHLSVACPLQHPVAAVYSPEVRRQVRFKITIAVSNWWSYGMWRRTAWKKGTLRKITWRYILYPLSVTLLLIPGLRVEVLFIVVYLTTLSVTRTVQRQMAERLVNGKGKALPVYVTEIYRGSRCITQRILKVSGHHGASSALDPAKKRRYLFNRGLAGHQRQNGRFRKTNILPMLGFEPRIFKALAQSLYWLSYWKGYGIKMP